MLQEQKVQLEGKVSGKNHESKASSKNRDLIKQEIAHIEENYEVFDSQHEYTKRVAFIGEKLRDKNSNEPIEFRVINAKKENAFALGNVVYIYTGMLNFCNTEAELAYVLAHEITHIEAGDTWREESSVSQDRANEYYADSVMHKLDEAGYNPSAIESVLARLAKRQGFIRETHGSSADRQAAIRTQLKLKDHKATGEKDNSKNPFEDEREEITKNQKVGIVDKFIELSDRNKIYKLDTEELDKISLVTLLKFVQAFTKKIFELADDIRDWNKFLDKLSKKRELSKQMRQLSFFVEYLENRIKDSVDGDILDDVITCLLVDFSNSNLVSMGEFFEQLEKISFELPEGVWVKLREYTQSEKKFFRLIENSDKIASAIESITVVTRKEPFEVATKTAPAHVADLISDLDFKDRRLSEFPQAYILEAIGKKLSDSQRQYFSGLV